MKNSTQNGTIIARPANDNANSTTNLPVALDNQRVKPSLALNKIPAEFISQLIAERSKLAANRPKRRAPVSLATKVYNAARKIAIKRMPIGYNHESNI